MAYPGLSTAVKTHLWKTIGSPTLMYGMESIPLPQHIMNDLRTCEGNIVKRVMGLGKRSKSTEFFTALHISRAENIIQKNTVSLYNRIFQVSAPLLQLQAVLMASYIKHKKIYEGTIIDRLIKLNVDPCYAAFNKSIDKHCVVEAKDGVVDSLKYILYRETYAKPWSSEHILTVLLTKAV